MTSEDDRAIDGWAPDGRSSSKIIYASDVATSPSTRYTDSMVET
jgi:hypothetical protein